jgi:hypothetical protein
MQSTQQAERGEAGLVSGYQAIAAGDLVEPDHIRVSRAATTLRLGIRRKVHQHFQNARNNISATQQPLGREFAASQAGRQLE